MKCYGLLIMVTCFLSCHNKHDTKEDAAFDNDTITDYDTSSVDPAEKISACYESASGKDTVYLRLFSTSEVITGSLQYRYYEKDNNNGSLQGNMHGDTLFADYIFMSEGKASVREVAFLKKGDVFIEGYGDVEMRNRKMIFSNPHALKFIGRPLQKVDCTSDE